MIRSFILAISNKIFPVNVKRTEFRIIEIMIMATAKIATIEVISNIFSVSLIADLLISTMKNINSVAEAKPAIIVVLQNSYR